MKKHFVSFALGLLTAGTIGYFYGCTPKDGNTPFELKIDWRKQGVERLLTDPLRDLNQADKFVDDFQKELKRGNGELIWPDTTIDGNKRYLSSWSIETKYIDEITKELAKIRDAKDKSIRIYPVINNEGKFSLMLVGDYFDANDNRHLLKYKIDASTGQQDGKDIAPMFEWIMPCPNDCPPADEDFTNKQY